MNKSELIAAVADRAGVNRKTVGDVLDALLDVISGALAAGDKVTLVGFGTFEVRERAARKGVNPATKEPIEIPAGRVPAFKASKTLRDAVSPQ